MKNLLLIFAIFISNLIFGQSFSKKPNKDSITIISNNTFHRTSFNIDFLDKYKGYTIDNNFIMGDSTQLPIGSNNIIIQNNFKAKICNNCVIIDYNLIDVNYREQFRNLIERNEDISTSKLKDKIEIFFKLYKI